MSSRSFKKRATEIQLATVPTVEDVSGKGDWRCAAATGHANLFSLTRNMQFTQRASVAVSFEHQSEVLRRIWQSVTDLRLACVRSRVCSNDITTQQFVMYVGPRSALDGDDILPFITTKRVFSFSGPAAWNSLPAELRDIKNSSAFIHHLKTHLLYQVFLVFYCYRFIILATDYVMPLY